MEQVSQTEVRFLQCNQRIYINLLLSWKGPFAHSFLSKYETNVQNNLQNPFWDSTKFLHVQLN